jgi:hypothetical protein
MIIQICHRVELVSELRIKNFQELEATGSIRIVLTIKGSS